jgi:hypothetical protein
MTCVVDNYDKIMQGKLLDQWTNVFRQKTNTSVILFLIVFADGEDTEDMWHIDDVSIKFDPLTKAFNKLYFISYIKMLFDETFDGKPSFLPPSPGTAATAEVQLSNPTGSDLPVPEQTYTFNDGVKDWIIPIVSPLVIPAGGSVDINVSADTVGSDADLAPGVVNNADVSPAPPADLVITVISVVQGTDPDPGPIEVPSKYFDLSLALAYLCKMDIKLSCFWTLVRLVLPVQSPDTNPCWIRSVGSAGQKDNMHSIKDDDRNKYYWGALYLMECINTMIAVHSEPVQILVEVLAAWFAERNASGQFVGNKLSLLRLSGTRIKPFGYPSWLNSEVNENDSDAFDEFDHMNVAYLATIADNTPQECYFSRARGITGLAINALMISKFVDYTSSQDCAKMVTDKGTLTDPVLTDELAYSRIQEIFKANLSSFTGTRRISNIQMKFPTFGMAKKGLTALEAASSWKANYKDDLDEVTVTGGIEES